MLRLWMGVGRGAGSYWLFGSPGVQILSSPESELFQEFHEICRIHDFWVPWSPQIGHWVVRRILLYIVCFAYSLLSLLILVLLVVLLLVLVICCLIKLSLSQPTSSPFCPFLLPIPLGAGKGRGERVAGWCLVASCQVKLREHKNLLQKTLLFAILWNESR